MSLKEWKDNELNTLLMKKWGLLKESKDQLQEDSKEEESEHYGEDESADKREEDRLEHHLDSIEHHLDALRHDMGVDQHREDDHMDEGAGHPGQSCDEAHPGEDHPVSEMMYRDDDCVDWDEETKTCLDKVNPESSDMRGNQYGMAKKMSENTSGKISVKEAKEITRRIIERIRKEGK